MSFFANQTFVQQNVYEVILFLQGEGFFFLKAPLNPEHLLAPGSLIVTP